jgi:hypothetical protein
MIRPPGFFMPGNRLPPRIKCGAGFFRIMLYDGGRDDVP